MCKGIWPQMAELRNKSGERFLADVCEVCPRMDKYFLRYNIFRENVFECWTRTRGKPKHDGIVSTIGLVSVMLGFPSCTGSAPKNVFTKNDVSQKVLVHTRTNFTHYRQKPFFRLIAELSPLHANAFPKSQFELFFSTFWDRILDIRGIYANSSHLWTLLIRECGGMLRN